MRKIVIYIATSADGFIARLDGSVDWRNRPRTAGDYGIQLSLRSCKNFSDGVVRLYYVVIKGTQGKTKDKQRAG